MITPPEVSISEIALSAFRDAAREAGDGEVLRLTIDAKFHNDLYFAAIEPNDVVIVVSGLELAMDARTARRANGLKIDFVEFLGPEIHAHCDLAGTKVVACVETSEGAGVEIGAALPLRIRRLHLFDQESGRALR